MGVLLRLQLLLLAAVLPLSQAAPSTLPAAEATPTASDGDGGFSNALALPDTIGGPDPSPRNATTDVHALMQWYV